MSKLQENSSVSLLKQQKRSIYAAILASSNFMSLLTDGFQTTKTGSEKEMVLIQTERAGKQTFSMEKIPERESFFQVKY